METLEYLIDLVLHLDKHLGPMIESCGPWSYVILAGIIFCETGLVVTPFLPGDSLLFAAGTMAAIGSLSLPMLLVTLTIAAILGDLVNYSIGKYFGEKLVAYRRIPLVKPEHLEKTQYFFDRYGAKTIVMARFMPIVRTLAPFVAGMGRMNYQKFMLYNVIGAIAWVLICTLAGYFLARFTWVKENFSVVILIIVIISILPAAVEFIRHRVQARSRPLAEPVAPDAASLETPGSDHQQSS